VKHFARLAIALASFVVLTPVLALSNTLADGASTPTTSLYNCTLRQIQPTSIVIACADSNRYIKEVKWTSWTSHQASATGTLVWNSCVPACYDGKFHSREISFLARDPKTVLSHRIFTQLYGPVFAWGTGSRIWELPTKPE
jgi:hypothetical protein